MSNNSLPLLNQLSTFLKINGAKFTLGSDQLPVCNYQNKSTKGFINIVLELIKSSKNSQYAGQSPSESAEIYQWLEYSLLNATTLNHNQLVKELNEVLMTKTYLVAYRLTIADVLLYYVMYKVFESLSYLDKEKYIHLSRWFDNIQQDKRICSKNKLIDFGTNYLVTCAPAKH